MLAFDIALETDWECENMAAAAEEGIALLNPLDIQMISSPALRWRRKLQCSEQINTKMNSFLKSCSADSIVTHNRNNLKCFLKNASLLDNLNKNSPCVNLSS